MKNALKTLTKTVFVRQASKRCKSPWRNY